MNPADRRGNMQLNTRATLLIVDDEPANLQKLKRTFLDELEVFEALSGEAALEILGHRCFSAIITDQCMPGMSGVDVLRASLNSSPEAVRIVLTGFTEVDYLMDAINQGQVHRYVTKPWDPFSLKRTVLEDIEFCRLKKESQLLNEQLRIAKKVQARLFPQVLPAIPGLEYFGICEQARDVGGDYYDFLQYQPGKLLIAVGDASGKGIGAALLMASLQALLRSQAPTFGDSLADLVKMLNSLLLERIQEEKFITLFLSVFDSNSKRFSYVNAGHNYPVLIKGRNGKSDTQYLESTGTIVGMFPGAEYRQEEILLEVGDMLMIYTDGLTEVVDSRDELFGEDRLVGSVTKHRHSPLEQISQETISDIKEYSDGADPVDDMTMVLARVVDSR